VIYPSTSVSKLWITYILLCRLWRLEEFHPENKKTEWLRETNFETIRTSNGEALWLYGIGA